MIIAPGMESTGLQSSAPENPAPEQSVAEAQPVRSIRFKKLELQGFKSFPDRTELVFNKDICAIVGPNGCGKSNILDAIRWVLGEQGPSQLRARAMADVIFNGAAGRKPVGMAEIALTIECPAGSVAMAFEEIEVTRRLYRSGDSEYLINRTPCRLKDIVDLFLDTGIGKGAYSLIEQGRVDALVTARPDERRLFIEQTAGIEKYKARKKEALSKLTSTEHNLERVLDVVSEVRSRRISLSRQARKASKYRSIKKELDEIRRLTIAGRYAHIHERIKVASRDMELVQNHMARNSAQHGLQAAALQESRKQVETVQSALARAGETADQAEMRMDYLETRVSDLRQRIADLEKEYSDGFKEADALDVKRRDLEEQARVLSEERGNRMRRMDALQETMLAIETRHQAALQKVIKARETLSELRKRRLDQVETLSRHQNRLSALDEGIRRMEQRIGSLEDASKRHGEAAAAAGSAHEAAQERVENLEASRNDCRHRLDACHREIRELTVEFDEAKAAFRSAENELLTMESRLKSLEEIRAAGEGLDSGVRAVLENFEVTTGLCRRGQICGMLADLYDANPDYEQALTAVFHPCLQDIIVNSAEAFAAVEAFLTERHLGRVTVRNAAAMEPQEPRRAPDPGLVPLGNGIASSGDLAPMFRGLLDGVYLAKDEASAERLSAAYPDLLLVTRDGCCRGPGPVITLSRAADSRMAYRRRRIDIIDLEKSLEAARGQRDRFREQMEDAAERMAASEARRTNAVQAIASSEQALALGQQDLKHAEEMLQQARRRRTDIEDERDGCLRELKNLKDQRAEAAETLEKTGRDTDVTDDIRRMESTLESLTSTAADIKEQLVESRIQVQTTGERVESAERERQHLVAEMDRLKEMAGRLRDQSEKKRLQCETSGGDMAGIVKELEDLVREQPSHRQTVENLRSRLEQVVTAEHELAEQVRELEKKDRDLEREMSEIRVTRAGLVSSAEALREDTHLDLDEEIQALGRIPDAEELADWKSQSEILQTNLDMLGEVNLAAEREHRELVERNRFLDEQIHDLQDSIASLRATIQQINKASRIRFAEAFDAVNAHFGEVFKRLFNGGEARLELLDPEDPLESGVDIVCKPPGKRARTIDLLSGGEKALGALSLLLAGFKYRPSPLLFLDEVDAPLDDANVVRFTEFLKDLAELTQVVMITHNATTMEVADILYGVTMENPGISRLVSARLSML